MGENQSTPSPTSPQEPKLLERLRLRLQAKRYGPPMQQRYLEWCRQFILFHGKKHPGEMGAAEIRAFLQDLGRRRLAMNWRREARDALGFLYREEIGREVELP